MTGELVERNGTHPAAFRRLSVSEAIRRRPLLAFGTPVAIVALTLLFLLWVRPVFQTNALIRIDEEEQGSVPMLQALQFLSAQGSQLQTEIAVLQSRSLTEQVGKATALQVTLLEPARTSRSAIVSALQVDTAALETTYTLQRTAPGPYDVSAVVVQPRDAARPFARARKDVRQLGQASPGVPFGIDGTALTLGPGAEAHDRIVVHVAAFPDAVKDMQEALVVSRPDREANVVLVTYQNTDPELAQSVVNELTGSFIVGRQGTESTEERHTVGFLQSQLDSLRLQLLSAEVRLRDFSTASRIIAPEEQAAGQAQRLVEMKAERDLKEAERSSLDQLMSEIRAEAARSPAPGAAPQASPYRRLLAFPTLFASPATGQLLAVLAEQENLLTEKLMVNTRADADVQLLSERIASLEGQLQSMTETYLTSLNSQVASYDAALAGFEDELTRVPDAQMTYFRLRRESEVLSGLYTLLQTRLKEAQIQAAMDDESVRVVDPAFYPREPVSPRPMFSLLIAVLIGSLLGVGGAVAAEQLDRSVRDRQDVGRVTGGSVLGLIPELREPSRLGNRLPMPWSANGRELRPRLVSAGGPGDPAAEAYRSLRTNLLFSRLDSPPRAVVFTSPMPGDGKSTTAANLALVLAQQGHRVLLVDADMRRGGLHEVLGCAREPGLSEVLLGRKPLSEALATVEREGLHFDFLPAGAWPPNSSELIASPAMRALLQESLGRYEMVILDAPPLNLVNEAAVLGTYCDGVILVARAGITEESPLEFAVQQLRSVRAPLLGTVLNGVDEAQQDYYGRGGRPHAYFGKN